MQWSPQYQGRPSLQKSIELVMGSLSEWKTAVVPDEMSRTKCGYKLSYKEKYTTFLLSVSQFSIETLFHRFQRLFSWLYHLLE